nr:glycoprotein 3 alpha L fucosyltransferase [Hymenolepis microstoma]
MVCIKVNVIVHNFGWRFTAFICSIKSAVAEYALTEAYIPEYRDDLFAYHHAVEQLEWLTEFSNKSDDLSVGRTPSIFYDRRIIYHVTSPEGCRYKCNFPRSMDKLREGDAAVFSTHFSAKEAAELKARGVIIVFESGECPIFMPHISPEESSQVDIFVSFMTASPVPWIYPMFVRNVYPSLKFSTEHISQMLSANNTHLLPSYHKNRTKLIAWVVSNGHPSNNRIQFADALAQFVSVDIYGRNGKLKLPDEGNPFQWLSRSYKFYLSFENSNCRQYITEKVQRNALR